MQSIASPTGSKHLKLLSLFTAYQLMVYSLRDNAALTITLVCFGSSELSGTSYLIQVIPNLGRRTSSHGQRIERTLR